MLKIIVVNVTVPVESRAKKEEPDWSVDVRKIVNSEKETVTPCVIVKIESDAQLWKMGELYTPALQKAVTVRLTLIVTVAISGSIVPL